MKLDDTFWGDAPAQSDTGNINLATTIGRNPDQEAEMQALGKRFGVPTDFVRADYDGFRQRAAIIDRKDSGQTPGIQAWVGKSPDNAAVAADHDLRVMGRIERTIRDLGEGFGGQFVGSGLTGIGHSLDALQRRIIGAAASLVLPKPMAGGEVDPNSLVGEPIGEGWRALGQPAKDYWKEKGVPDYQKDFGDQVVTGLGQVIGQLPLSASPAGWAMMFGQGADQLADKVAKDDAPQWKKDLAILGGGAVTAITEKWALDHWAKLGPLASLKNPIASRVAGVGIAAASEGGQEFTENALQDLLRQQLTNPNAPIDWGDAAYSGGVGATVGGIVRTVIESALHIRGRHQQQFFQNITEAAKDTGLTQRAPDKLADFVTQAADGSPVENVFIPAEAFTRYFQSIGADPAQAAQMVGATNYDEAQAAGTDVVIPVGEFTAKLAPSEHMGPLMPDMRLHQGDLTARELEAMQANKEARDQYLQQQYEQLLAEGESTRGINAAIDRVVTDVEGQLLSSGVERSTAKTQAQLMRGVAVLAQRAFPNRDPVAAAEKLWDQYGLTVQRDLPPILTHLKNADVQLDPLLDRLRAGAIPKEQEAFGQPLHEFIRSMGGVQDQGGELSARDADVGNAPFVKNLIQQLGMDFDGARELASQHGFPVGETESDFISALTGSLEGNPVYSPNQENSEALDMMHTLESLDRALKDAGVDLNAVDNATARKMLEQAGEVTGARFNQSLMTPEERRDALIAMPAINLDDKTLDGLEGSELRAAASERFKAMKGHPARTADGRTVQFTGVGLREIKQHSADRNVLELMAKADEVVPEAIPLFSVDHERSGPHDAIRAWHYYGAKVSIRGEEHYAKIVVRESVNGEIYYDNDLTSVEEVNGRIGDATPTKSEAATVSADQHRLVDWMASVNQRFYQAAYHGSPYRFDKFSLAHMGRGEGAQAYGWGLYFAGNKEVAEYYRGALSNLELRVDGGEFDNENPAHRAAAEKYEAEKNGWKLQDVIERIKRSIEDLESRGKPWADQEAAIQRKTVEMLESGKKLPKYEEVSAGQLYKVEIQDSDYLLWDKPLSEQPEAVKQALREAGILDDSGEAEERFADSYAAAVAELGGNAKDVKQAILNLVRNREMTDTDWNTLLRDNPQPEGFDLNDIHDDYRPKYWTSFYNHTTGERETHPAGMTGESAYRELTREMNGGAWSDPQEAASRYLNSLGIAGIKYLDGSSRSAGEGDHNYVVFDDNAINVLHTYYQQQDEKKRGFLEIGNDRKMRIGLTENANLSTFLHETGHFYLEMMGDLAANPEAAQQVKDDYAAILSWMGVTDRSQITVEQHEKFARANEAYLMEGKAPAPELRGAFQRFKAWLTHIYRSLTALDVKLSNEVRDVFDRIYATDQEIEAAKDAVDVAPLFVDATTMGMSEAEFAVYKKSVGDVSATAQERLTEKLMREYQRGLQAWWKDERANVKKEVTAEVEAQPVYRAFSALVSGELNGDAFKLAKTDLVRRYGETYLKNLPRGFQRIYVADGGIDIDTAAEMAGFESGDALVKALVEMRPKNALIDAETDQRMAERHGDMMLDGTMADAAKAALHNEKRADMLAIELRALKRKAKEVAPFVRQAVGEVKAESKEKVAAAQAETKDAMAKAKAEQSARIAATDVPAPAVFRRAAAGIIDQMQVKDIQPNAYLIAGRKAAREAFAAMARNDVQTAAAAKQRELLNHYLYLEATKAKQEADAIQKFARSFEKSSKREKIAKAGGDYLGQIDALLARYELAKVTLNALSRRERLREFIASREADGDIVVIPEELQDESRQVNWREAPMFELRALNDALKNLEHLASFKNKLLRKRAAIDFAAVKLELLQALEDNIDGSTGERGKLNDKGDTLADRIKKSAMKLDAGLLKVEQMLEWMDGGKINGPWARYVFDLADDAQTREYDLHAQVTKRIQDLHESMPKAWGNSLYDKTDIHLPGIDHALSRYDLISIAMNAGNQSNYDKLLKGRNWSEGQVQSALSRMTDSDWEYVQGVWDAIESLWPEIAALQKRVAGVEPAKIEPKKIITASGREFAGGYFPLVYDPTLSRVGEKQDDASESVQDFMARGYGRANTDKGHTKGRIEDFAAPLRLDYEQVLTSHLAKVIKDISHREAILSMNKILNDSQIKAALIDKIGMDKYQLIATWEQSLISDRADTLHRPLQWYNAIFRGLRTNTAIVTMGWKLSTTFSQLAGFAASMDTVKPKYLGTALRDFVVRPGEMLALTMEKSGEMRHRAGTIERDVKEQLLKTRGKHGMKVSIQRSAFYLTGMADRIVSVPTWVGGYRQALDAGLSEEDAVRSGDRAVRLSQGSGGAKDLAAVQRNSDLMKLLTMYYTPFSVLYARLRDMGHSYQEPKDLPRLVARSIALVILPAVLGELLAGRGPDDDEDKTLWSIRKMLLYPFASVPLIRDLANWKLEPELAKASGGNMQYQPGYKFTPIISAVEKILGMPEKLIDGLTGARPWDDVAWDELEASGYLFGLPTAQVRITGSYLYDLFTGKASPQDAAEAMHDTLFRRPAERR